MKRYWRVGLWVFYTAVLGFLHFRSVWIGWVVGMGLSLVVLIMDRLLYVWWLKPYEQLSIQVQYWMKQKDLIATWRLLHERGSEQTRLVLRSAGFAVLWPFLTIYVLTSTGSVLALGILMGLGLDLGYSILSDWNKPQQMGNWLCWQIKRPFLVREVKILAGSFVSVWILFSLLLLVR